MYRVYFSKVTYLDLSYRHVGRKREHKTEVKDVKLGRKPSLPSAIEKKLNDYPVEMN